MPRQPRTFRAEAVVLRHSDWGEADRLLTLFTREEGKLRAIAKGARKPRSRKAGHLEPLTRVSLLLARGRSFFIVTQAETVDAHLPLTEDLELVGYGSYVLELLDRFTHDEDENRALYRLLSATLTRLVAGDDPGLVLRYYELRLLDAMGYRPELFQCVACEAEIQAEDQYFSAGQGGVLCPRCGAGQKGARPVSREALRYLRHYQRSSYTEAARARVPAAVALELENLMHNYLTYLLERALHTPTFLRQVKKGHTEP